jgi:hypothetical protein
MAIKLTTTSEAAAMHGVKVLVYGGPGVGKTMLCSTAPNPIIISAEAGLLSLRDFDIPVIEINNIDDLDEAYNFLATSKDAAGFETFCLDSISEIAETCLTIEKAKNPDPRKFYVEMADRVLEKIRMFRDISGRHVYFSAKAAKERDDKLGGMLYQPSMPGRQLGQALPYMFDEVFVLRVEEDNEGRVTRWLQTQPDPQHDAKDRSGRLDRFEQPNLTDVINKIIAPTQPLTNEEPEHVTA